MKFMVGELAGIQFEIESELKKKKTPEKRDYFDEHAPKKRINVIIGGSKLFGQTINSIKRY